MSALSGVMIAPGPWRRVRSHGEAQDNPTTVEGTVRTRPDARFARVYPHNTIQTGTFCSYTTFVVVGVNPD